MLAEVEWETIEGFYCSVECARVGAQSVAVECALRSGQKPGAREFTYDNEKDAS